MARPAGQLKPLQDLLQSVRPLAQSRHMGHDHREPRCRPPRCSPDDRYIGRPRPPAWSLYRQERRTGHWPLPRRSDNKASRCRGCQLISGAARSHMWPDPRYRLCSTLLQGLPQNARLLADRGYDADRIRAFVAERGASAAAGLYVVSHHTVQSGLIDLETFCRMCREKSVPVIVDGAADGHPTAFLKAGADLVITSMRKALAGFTAATISGRMDLVRACYLNDKVVCRPTKVGKDSVIATIAALERWQK